MDAECARMNCEERATVLMAYDPRNARAWLRDLTDAHPSLGLSLCSWHAASTSVPMGWECIDERRGMRFGLDDIDEPEAGFLFTEEPTIARRLLSEPPVLDVADDEIGQVGQIDEPSTFQGDPAAPNMLSSSSQVPIGRVDDPDPIVVEPYVTRFDDRGRFDEAATVPTEPVIDEPIATGLDPAPPFASDLAEPDDLREAADFAEPADLAEAADLVAAAEILPVDEASHEPDFDLPEPEPIRILDREAGRAPSVSYFDDDGYSEPIAIPLDEIDGIELGFEPLMAGDELNDLKLEAAERFTVIEPVADDEFEDFEPVPEPIVSGEDDDDHRRQPELAIDAATESEYLLTPDIDADFAREPETAPPHLVAVDEARVPEYQQLDAEAEQAPEGFSAEFLAADPVDDAPVWADDEPSWRAEPEPGPEFEVESPVQEAADQVPPDLPAVDQGLHADALEEQALDDAAFELPRLFDDIGYAEIDDDETDDSVAAAAPVDDEEIDPDDELSFDDIFPSMVNRPPTQAPPSAPQSPPAPNGDADPHASVTQQQLPTIGTGSPSAPERTSHHASEQLRPPVARSQQSFEHLVFKEDPLDTPRVDGSPASLASSPHLRALHPHHRRRHRCLGSSPRNMST